MRKRENLLKIIWYLYLVLILIMVAFRVVSYSNHYQDGSFDTKICSEYADGWQLQIGDKTYEDVSLPATYRMPANCEQVVLTRTLPQYLEGGWYLAVPAPRKVTQIYIDGKLMTDYHSADGLLRTSVPNAATLFIRLQSSYRGEKLAIIYKGSPERDHIDKIGMIYMGDRADIIYRLIRNRAFYLFAGVILIAFGVSLPIMRFFMKKWIKRRDDYAYLGIYLSLIGLWLCLQSGLNQVIFHDIAYARALEYFVLMMMPIPIIRHFDSITKHRFQVPASILSFISILVIPLSFLLIYGFHLDYPDVIGITLGVFLVMFIYVITSFIILFRTDKKLFRELHIMILANLIFGIGTAAEIVYVSLDSYGEDGRFVATTSLIYSICVFIWGILQIRKDDDEVIQVLRKSTAKSAFLANMSHEIRTPVNAIIGISAMMRQEIAEPEIKVYADDIEKSGRSLLDLINKILDSSKLESGKMQENKVEYEVKSLIEEMIHTADAFQKEHVSLIVRNNPYLPSVLRGDVVKIRQIIRNILENAFQYTEDGAVVLSFDYKQTKKDSIVTLLITVQDTGKGMIINDEKEVFSQFRHNLQEKTSGAGLGLSIALKMAQLLKGDILVRSAIGIGTEFRIEIPQEVVSSKPLGRYQQSNRHSPKNNPFIPNGLRILAVDDEPMNLKILTGMFEERTDVVIETAPDGFMAIEKAKVQKYDVILMDHQMPGMNGVDTFHALRQDPCNINRETPVIMLTANDSEDYQERVEKEGFAGYIMKPVTRSTVLDALLRCKIGGDVS